MIFLEGFLQLLQLRVFISYSVDFQYKQGLIKSAVEDFKFSSGQIKAFVEFIEYSLEEEGENLSIGCLLHHDQSIQAYQIVLSTSNLTEPVECLLVSNTVDEG